MLEPCPASKRDCCQRWLVTLVSEAINSQAPALRERERWSARTRCIAEEESATTMTSPSHLFFLPPLPPRLAFPPVPRSALKSPSPPRESMRTFIVYVQPPTFKPPLLSLPSILHFASKLPDLPQAVLAPGSITESYGEKLGVGLHQKKNKFTFFKVKKFGKIAKLKKKKNS